MVDLYDDKDPEDAKDPLNPLNIKKNQTPSTAVSIQDATHGAQTPTITAAGRGKIAEQIIQLAFENDIKIREDSALAEILATVELDSPIPSEAFMAVAEILSYVYRANGHTTPYDAVFSRQDMDTHIEELQQKTQKKSAENTPQHSSDKQDSETDDIEM